MVAALEVAAGFAFKKWIQTETGRAHFDAVKLKVPVFGRLLRKTALTRFARNLAVLLRSEVPILDALEITSETVGNEVMIGAGSALLGPIEIGERAKIGANSVVIHDVPPNSTVVGNPGHPVRVDGKKPEGPDADWVHLPDPVADAISGLANRLNELEELVAEQTGRKPGGAEVRPLKRRGGPDSAGG